MSSRSKNAPAFRKRSFCYSSPLNFELGHAASGWNSDGRIQPKTYPKYMPQMYSILLQKIIQQHNRMLLSARVFILAPNRPTGMQNIHSTQPSARFRRFGKVPGLLPGCSHFPKKLNSLQQNHSLQKQRVWYAYIWVIVP